MFRLVSVVLLVGWVNVGVSQNLRHSFRNYTAIDGLPQSQVKSIVEDENGYLWIGTQGGGLARFDGREFKVYTTLDGLLSNFIQGICIDQQKNLWILHPRGLTKFDGYRFKQFLNLGMTQTSKSYRRLFIQDNAVYVFSETGLSKIENDSVQYEDKPVADRPVLISFQAPSGELCFFLQNGQFLILEDEERYTMTSPVKERFFNPFWYGEEQWIRSKSGTYRLNFKERKLEEIPVKFDHFVLRYDDEKDFYWTRDQENLFKETLSGRGFAVDTTLKDVEVVEVLPDSEGNVWFASDGRGLFKRYLQDFDRLTPDNLRGVMAVHVDKEGDTWIGSMSKGLWKIKNETLISYYDERDPYRNMISDIGESPDGTLWVATGNGLGRYDRDHDNFQWITSKEGLSISNVRNFVFDEKGGMWLGTLQGVNYYDGKTFKYFTTEDGLKHNGVWVNTYLPSAKTLFVGNEFGLNTIRDGKVGTIDLPELENAVILGLHSYRDSLLVVGSAGSGVMVLDPKTLRRRLITRHDGLTSDFVYFVTTDSDDKIWVGTEKGITRLQLNDAWEIVENLHYDEANGLEGIETNQGAYYITDKEKYFGLVDGLYQFNDLSRLKARSFGLHLTDVEIFYGDYSAREFSDSLAGFFQIPVNPILPSDKNHITFHFNRVDKRYPKSVKFRYLLQNFDKTWSQPSSTTQVTYSNLPPGNYAFRVMATNNEGSWSDEKILYTFTVKAPFYQTASFIAGLIIFVAGSITLLMYLRVRQRVKNMIETERIRIKEQESLRKEIARDFHDEMGNQLTRIINYVSLLKLNGNGNGNSNGHKAIGNHYDLYSKVEESAKVLYTGTRDFIWSIDPVNDELSKLFVHIRDFGEKLFEEKGINFRAYDEVKEKLKLPHGFSREANLIFKEAMTNAFKYSQAQNVTFSLRRNESRFEMMFEDDGIGFNADQIGKSNGLKNIRERADRVGSLLRIRSERGGGTRITLDFSLNKSIKYGHAF